MNCHYFANNLCRSCPQLELPEAERAPAKMARLRSSVQAALGTAEALTSLWSPREVFPSRSKAKLSVTGTLERPVLGLVDRNINATELLNCPLHFPRLNQIAALVKTLIAPCKLTPYDIKERRGELKGLILKANHDSSQILLRFVLRSTDAVGRIRKILPTIQAAHPEVKVISCNIQPIPAAVLEGPEEIVLTEQTVIWEIFGAVELAFGPQSFAQVTPETARALYAHVAARLATTPGMGLLDLYCGVGGFSISSAASLKWGHGVELSTQAIDCAQRAAKKNGLTQLNFSHGDVAELLKTYSGPRPDAVVVNPPRRGLSPEIIEYIKALQPRQIIYSSCNPETLLRDLKLFMPRYQVLQLAPFDMFPLTEHVEVVATLRL